jgi:hypothetical protein
MGNKETVPSILSSVYYIAMCFVAKLTDDTEVAMWIMCFVAILLTALRWMEKELTTIRETIKKMEEMEVA